MKGQSVFNKFIGSFLSFSYDITFLFFCVFHHCEALYVFLNRKVVNSSGRRDLIIRFNFVIHRCNFKVLESLRRQGQFCNGVITTRNWPFSINFALVLRRTHFKILSKKFVFASWSMLSCIGQKLTLPLKLSF